MSLRREDAWCHPEGGAAPEAVAASIYSRARAWGCLEMKSTLMWKVLLLLSNYCHFTTRYSQPIRPAHSTAAGMLWAPSSLPLTMFLWYQHHLPIFNTQSNLRDFEFAFFGLDVRVGRGMTSKAPGGSCRSERRWSERRPCSGTGKGKAAPLTRRPKHSSCSLLI